MKLLRVETLISQGPSSTSKEWETLRKKIHHAIKAVDWPPGSGKFLIYPESGKKRGKGNGVGPIKNGLISKLLSDGWIREKPIKISSSKNPGHIDAVLTTKIGDVAIEWETGNISSSHRAINKMLVCLSRRILVVGVLVVPSRKLYNFLTDRVGNFEELVPYFELWRQYPIKDGVLEIVEIEQDGESLDVPKIRKGTDGRALG